MLANINSSRLRIIFISALLLIFIVSIPALGGSARKLLAGLRQEKAIGAAGQSQTARVPQRTQNPADFESELITVTPRGFESKEITQPRGRFLLMIDNRSGLERVALKLTREGGARVREMRVPRETPDWSELMDLEPGRYLLSEANHPNWVCVITITR